MAKKKQSKIGKVALALVMVLTMGAAATSLTMGIKNNDWFKKDDTQTEEQTQEENSGVGAVIGDTQSNGTVRLMSASIPVDEYDEYGVSPLSENAYTLTATITPDNATNKAVDWSVAWKNPSSAWANGKNISEYVTVAASSDGALTATVSCLKAFGEQVVITVTSRDNPSVTGSVNVDYVKRVTDVTLSVAKANAINFTDTFSYTVTPIYSDGTIDGTFSLTNATVGLESSFIRNIRNSATAYTYVFRDSALLTSDLSNHTFKFQSESAYDNFVSSSSSSLDGGSSGPGFGEVDGSTKNDSGLEEPSSDVPDTDSPSADVPDTAQPASEGISPYAVLDGRIPFNNAFAQVVIDNSSANAHAYLTIYYTYTYNGTTYSNGNKSANLKFASDAFAISVTSISLNSSSLVF